MRLPTSVCLVFLLFAPAGAEPLDRLPGKETNLVLAAPITTWDEGIPLGNGLLGGLLWGEGQTIRLSLDRGDLWDERPREGIHRQDFNYATMICLVKEGKNDQFNAIFDYPYNGLYPTKIPAGRLEITLAAGQRLQEFELDLASAEGRGPACRWLAGECFLQRRRAGGACSHSRPGAQGTPAARPAVRPAAWLPAAAGRPGGGCPMVPSGGGTRPSLLRGGRFRALRRTPRCWRSQ